MDIIELKKQIMENKLNTNLFIFTCTDVEFMFTYIRKLHEVSKNEYIITDNLDVVKEELNPDSFLTDSKFVVLVNCVEALSCIQQLQTLIEGTQNILIVAYTLIEKKISGIKDTDIDFFNFGKIQRKFLIKHIQEHLKLSTSNCETLCELCKDDYGRILLECDKIRCYMSYSQNTTSTDNVFKKLFKEGVIYNDKDTDVFELVNACIYNDFPTAFKLFERYKLSNPTSIPILSLLYNNFRNMLLIAGCEPDRPISEQTPMSEKQAWVVKKYMRYYSVSQILQVMDIIRDLETGIKSGVYEDSQALNYFLIQVQGV